MDEHRILRPDRAAVTAARENAGLTKYGLAKALGCSRSTITDIESGRRGSTLRLLTAIADTCGVSVETLVAADEPARPAAEEADGRVSPVQDEERPVGAHDVPVVRGAVVGGA